MANYYQYKPGLGAVGQYQVSGKPFITGSVDCSAAPTEISFPSVTSWIVVQNHSTASILFSGFRRFNIHLLECSKS